MKIIKNKHIFLFGFIALLITCLVLGLIYVREPILENSTRSLHWSRFLAPFNAVLNFFSLIFLILGRMAIAQKKKEIHKKLMYTALVISSLFLVSYILYHLFHGEMIYKGVGMIRYFYFSILISHIILSGILPFFVLKTLYHAFTENFFKHKKIARITFPIWIYVNGTGILIYLWRL